MKGIAISEQIPAKSLEEKRKEALAVIERLHGSVKRLKRKLMTKEELDELALNFTSEEERIIKEYGMKC